MSDTIHVPDGICKINSLMCGCGNPEQVWADVLAELKRIGGTPGERPCMETGQMLTAYVIDTCGLSEHGGSVHGAWLTEDGDAALAFLEQYGPEWDSSDHPFDDDWQVRFVWNCERRT